MPEMNEKDLDEYLEKLEMSQFTRGWIDEMRCKLRQRGILLVANTENVPICFGVDYTEHDKEIEKKYVEQIAKQSELIRGYDREILELKAQCRELTQNERLSYKRLNGDKSELPTEPIKIADYLIDWFMKDLDKVDFAFLFDDMRKLKIENLRQIAEHLLVFCGRM